MTVPTKQFLDVLVANKIISPEQAQKSEVDSLQKNVPIDEYLVQFSGVSQTEIIKAKATVLNIPWVTGESMPVAPQALALIPESLARKYFLIPFELNEKEGTLKVAMADPFDVQTIEFLQKKTNVRIIPTMALKDDIEKTIDVVYTQSLSPNITEALKEFSPTSVNTVKSEQIGLFCH